MKSRYESTVVFELDSIVRSWRAARDAMNERNKSADSPLAIYTQPVKLQEFAKVHNEHTNRVAVLLGVEDGPEAVALTELIANLSGAVFGGL